MGPPVRNRVFPCLGTILIILTVVTSNPVRDLFLVEQQPTPTFVVPTRVIIHPPIKKSAKISIISVICVLFDLGAERLPTRPTATPIPSLPDSQAAAPNSRAAAIAEPEAVTDTAPLLMIPTLDGVATDRLEILNLQLDIPIEEVDNIPTSAAFGQITSSTPATTTTTTITPSIVAQIYGGGANYSDGINGIPFALGSGNLAYTNPIIEASQCDQNELPPPSYRIRRVFIEYNIPLTPTLSSAQLVFSVSQPFAHDGTGHLVHDLNIHQGNWTKSSDITPTTITPGTFQAWNPTPLASIDFNGPYPQPITITLAITPGETIRLLFRSNSENNISPQADSCTPTGSAPTGIGNAFNIPVLVLGMNTDQVYYLPLILKTS